MRICIFICLYIYIYAYTPKLTCHLKRDYLKKKGKDRLPVPVDLEKFGNIFCMVVSNICYFHPWGNDPI